VQEIAERNGETRVQKDLRFSSGMLCLAAWRKLTGTAEIFAASIVRAIRKDYRNIRKKREVENIAHRLQEGQKQQK
jgi:hypothetical protein